MLRAGQLSIAILIGALALANAVARAGPAPPFGPEPGDGQAELDFRAVLLTWNNPPDGCDLENGSFETGSFTGWSALTGPGNQLTPWAVEPDGGGDGFLGPGFAAGGLYFAQNGFDGDAGLFYELRQTVTIPPDATVATLEWEERIRWDLLTFPGATIPRTYTVRVVPEGGGPTIATLYTDSLRPDTIGDTGYVYHLVDVIAAGVTPGTTVDFVWREDVPQAFTGPAQFEFDAARLTCAPPESLRGVNLRLERSSPDDAARTRWSDQAFEARREAYLALRSADDPALALDALRELNGAGEGDRTAPEGAGVVYDVLLDPFFPPTTLICAGAPAPECGPLAGLLPGATYFWQVIRREGSDAAAGPVWTFTTDQDCQPNGIPDNEDVLVGTSQDCDSNFIPDECEHCFGDINDDLLHDTADLGILLAAFATSDCFSDLNADGVVNTADLGILLGLFLAPCTPP